MNYEKLLNPTVTGIAPSGIRKFFDVLNEMPDAISLGVGEPDFVTPWYIRDAAIRSIKKGYTAYTSNWGAPELRELISRYLDERFTLKYDPKDEIVVTIGASEAIDLTLRCVVSPGDEVLVPSPAYVSYSPGIALAGGKPVALDLRAEDSFRLTKGAIEKAVTPRTKAIIVPYPCNPTGAVMEKHHLEEIAAVIKKHDLFVISDEIYAELTYGGKHVSIAALEGMRERTLVLNGFSKAFAMTGWRVGYAAGPREIIKYICRVHQYVIMCAPTVSQHAAIEALKGGFSDNFAAVEEMKQEYDMRRRFLLTAFNDIGLTSFEPKGAFYIFPSVKASGMSGDDFAEKLLYDQKVAVIPGSAFGGNCKDFVRCCYASSMKNLVEAAERIDKFLHRIK